MLRLILGLIFTCFSLSTFSQYNKHSITPATKEEYLLISKREKRAAWGLLGAGSAMFIAATLIGTKKESTFGGSVPAVVLGGFSVLSVSASIPLFILSGKNKRRAMKI